MKTKTTPKKEIVQFETYTQDQIEVLDELSKQTDKEIIANLDDQFEQERAMAMYENHLNTW